VNLLGRRTGRDVKILRGLIQQQIAYGTADDIGFIACVRESKGDTYGSVIESIKFEGTVYNSRRH
jgi:hypothetical protein